MDLAPTLAASLVGSSNSSSCEYQWADKYLGECVHNERQLAGLILGLSSILCWMVAQTPQLYKNFRNSTAEGLSGAFLADWLAGDITNLVGCILTKQVPTQLYTAIWFCIIDTCMLVQWLYYNKFRRKPGKVYVVYSVVCVLALSPLLMKAQQLGGGDSFEASASSSATHHGRNLLTINSFSSATSIAGWSIGWVSGLMYFTSRIPQIVKNFRRRSCEGLSLAMFCMAILGNITYALGVLLQSVERDFLIDHMPWLLGSVGTLIFDFTIFCQFLCFGGNTSASANGKTKLTESDPLLQTMP
ncbi:hypothetical protein PTSG_00968 [Salpingoeca rosetta]|uniref:Uncharacterized protein n=1 Tax=Salpingoeca rosetta (strain ATCC 50818 / BSB-021) TaxID=946362 RepID=F2TY06_SALR5|nr:uncharacterized protein PTSG_00968 [Salpingoeca rosetta]EGD76265.1 hypothetical protein PTSG_00968 [Salpingoeca rosetta]|eukprot:XP_004998440.1 hypothetical protein PTSG_00968 [Salpingoeca rosetta]